MRVVVLIVLSAVMLDVLAAEKIRVSCIGNSITQGNMGGKYPVFLQQLLGTGYQVENDGVSGTTLLKKGDNPYWTKGKLGQVFAFKPDIVTIKLGTNDTKSQNWDLHKTEFKDDLLSMMDTLNLLSPRPDIFLVLPAPVFKNTYGIRDSILKPVMAIIKEVASERSLPLIDANTPLLGLSRYFKDGVHPDDAGSDTIAHIIYRALMDAINVAPLKSTLHVEHKQEVYVPYLSICGSHPFGGVLYDLAGRKTYCSMEGGRVYSARAGVYINQVNKVPSGKAALY